MAQETVPNNCKKCSTFKNVMTIVAVLAALFPVYRTYMAGDPLSYMYANALLFTPWRELARETWTKTVQVDYGVKREMQHVAIIEAKDYTLETLKKATDGWRHPAIVRGLFSDSNAVTKWNDADYLPERIGHFNIPVVNKAVYNTLQNDRSIQPFPDVFREIYGNSSSKKYLFFPVKSRFNFNGSEAGSVEALQDKLNDIALEDLDLSRIWPGFGTKNHASYYGTQIIIGQGSNDKLATTGTGWHCAAGNNWFVQVIGSKRWYFMDQQYSAAMYPLRGGKVNMMTGNPKMSELHEHMNLRYADVYAGDLLYNPDWEWHTIQNYEGLSIGCPIREFNVSLSAQNNLMYTSIVLVNKFLEKFGLDIGGYPPS